MFLFKRIIYNKVKIILPLIFISPFFKLFTLNFFFFLGNMGRYVPAEYPYSNQAYMNKFCTQFQGPWTLAEEQRPGSTSPSEVCNSGSIGVPPLSHQPMLPSYSLSPTYGTTTTPLSLYTSTTVSHGNNYIQQEPKSPYNVWQANEPIYPYH